MSGKYVKPSVYSKMSYTSKTVPPGYVGALMMNMAKQREMREQYSQPAIEQILSSDELKNRRNQISLDYNYFLKKIGNDNLKKALGELADDISMAYYDNIEQDVISNLPARVDTMPSDMDSMEALINELNNTNKSILIMDEIYINAMLTMYLNEYNNKETRDTTFLFRPFKQIKSFTDSEGMFTSEKYHKIDTLENFDYSIVDLVYLDLSLMKDVLYYVLCQVIISIMVSRNKLSRARTHIVKNIIRLLSFK